MKNPKKSGSFTMPTEVGYEELTLQLAERWGADAVRDCDGARLPEQILNAQMDVYATICLIREHNELLQSNPHFQQQTFLESTLTVSATDSLSIPLLDGYSKVQFEINENSLDWWQVHNRTTGKELPASAWSYDPSSQSVIIDKCEAWHQYSVNFLAYRIWEEINMYNHVTNDWNKEPLRQLDPRYPEVQAYLRTWMKEWCESHQEIDVVRFTSLFYNFVWIWSDHPDNPHLFTDWASYDFTVSPLALTLFAEEYGYTLSAEDFINKGYRNPSHVTWEKPLLDYMEFTNKFVCSFAKELVQIVQQYGKKAYVFYDDSWVGMEPQSQPFQEIGFDGIIKCVFSGFESRLCSAVTSVKTHELRLHPYLFPVGLGGAPTFSEGGDPALDARTYWAAIRRAILREPVDRLGVGGILHLVEDFPDFVDAIADIAEEFREIVALHAEGGPWSAQTTIGVLTTWGALRTWTCGGHYHEHPDLDLINILESLSGLPVQVKFLSFEELTPENLKELDIVINAGFVDSSYSGGHAWTDGQAVQVLTQWVHNGGVFLGINEPSYLRGHANNIRMNAVLAVDIDEGHRLCHGKWRFTTIADDELTFTLEAKETVFLTGPNTTVLQAKDGIPQLTINDFGLGKGVYMSGYRHSPQNTAALHALIQRFGKERAPFASDNPFVEWTWYPASRSLVLSNSSDLAQKAAVSWEGGELEESLKPHELKIVELE
ncbi:MAG: 1,3-beta-galactosyl-N-acetylhexosamine phosphorylase [Sphaerochaeta sp.]|jgi:beta-D-galactosyl-(1->4)-L-rhamnose phosphorylase